MKSQHFTFYYVGAVQLYLIIIEFKKNNKLNKGAKEVFITQINEILHNTVFFIV